MKFRGSDSKAEKIAPQMAPMIDVVFQLLIFFMLTLKIILPEGEFGINMPPAQASDSQTDDPLMTEMKIRVLAAPDGSLGALELNGKNLGADDAAFEELTAAIRLVASDEQAKEELSVEVDPDYDLDYRWFIKTVGAVSGEKAPDGTYVPLVQNIKFAPARKE